MASIQYKMVYGLFKLLGVNKMLSKFDSQSIRFFGASSGGGLALSVCMYIKHAGLNIPLPEKLVLQSPGLQVPPSKEQKDEMNLIKFVPEAKAVRQEYFAALR